MSGINVQVEGMDALVSSLEAYRGKVPERVKGVMAEIGHGAKDVMDSYTPVRTGRLKGNNTVEIADDGFVLSNDTPYAVYVNYGTRHQSAQPFIEPALEWARQMLGEQLLQAMEFRT